MASTAELYEQTETSPTRLALVHTPSIDDIMQYSVQVKFDRATDRPDEVSRLVEEAKELLQRDPTADPSAIEDKIEKELLLDAEGLDDFARVFVRAHMDEYDIRPGTCGLAGMRYVNHYPGDMGLLLWKTRVKKGRNTLAKAFRKSQIDQETARMILLGSAPYDTDHQNQTLTYQMDDCSATRGVFETQEGVHKMMDWIDGNPDMQIVGFEEKDKPTYWSKHLKVRYDNRVREVQLTTAESEQASCEDGYHGPTKNDVIELARQLRR